MGCQHPHHTMKLTAQQQGVVGGWAPQHHPPLGNFWGVCGGPSAPVPASVGAPTLLLARGPGCSEPSHWLCQRSIPHQPLEGPPHPGSSGSLCPLAAPAASAEPPSRAFTAHSLRGWGWVSASCWGLSMPAGWIWVKSAPPRTKGRLPSGVPGAAHPGEPRAPHKVLPRPQPSGTDHRGGSAGAPAALWGAPHLPPPLECTGGPQSRRLCQGHAG